MLKKLQLLFFLFVLLFSLSGCDVSTTITDKTDTKDTTDQNSSSIIKPQLNNSNISVDENIAVGTTLLQIDVKDTGDSTIISYTIDDNVNFEIMADGTLKNRVSFDYETQREYNLSVYATNSAGASNIAHVDIEIKDIDEKSDSVVKPQLNDSNISVYENIAIGTALLQIDVNDTGNSQIVSYTIDDDVNFQVSADGTLKNRVGFDYETQTEYNLSVYATNSVGNSNIAHLNIQILNKYEFVPQLNDSSKSVDENLAVGSTLLQIDVKDTGDSSILSYAIDDNVNFEIMTDGTLKNRVSFDYETQHEYNLSVYATNSAGDSNIAHINIQIQDKYEALIKSIPALVVIMNWNDYAENDPTLWYDKFFNLSKNSVDRWFNENSVGEISFAPVSETQGITNDGIVTVSMNKNHPGGNDDYAFRDTEIVNAITNAAVVDNVDFAALDTNSDGTLSAKELQIIFIVAGGEESYGDNAAHSIWAHAWSFPSNSSLKVDGVYVMKYTGDEETSGSYARFGANHGSHKATIGIICHELGHAAFNLLDYYDDGGGSGLGIYDIMSNGSWAYQLSDTYPGQTPTQYSVYNKIDAGLDVNVTEVSATQELTMKCDGREFVKLVTSKSNEYFLLECRDTSKSNSDISFAGADSSFGENRLFAMLYHVDTDKDDNTENGSQTSYRHYKVGLVEKDATTLMTSTERIEAEFKDVYTLGDVITKTKLYNGSSTNYAVEIVDEDYSARTIKIKITK